MPLRLIFMGTPEFAVPTLLELVAHDHEVAAVYSRAAKPAGRGMKLQPTPVAMEATRLGIPVRTPSSLKTPEALAEFRAVDADAAIVVAYGMILPQAILDGPKLGCFNLHGSLLPRWRGAAPIQRAILAGDATTGITIMQMDEGLDTGPILDQSPYEIRDRETAGSLTDGLAGLGALCIVRTLTILDRLVPKPQENALATYAAKVTKAEAQIDWHRSSTLIDRQIRAFDPLPGAQTRFGEATVKIRSAEPAAGHGQPGEVLRAGDQLLVACGEGALRIGRLQRTGGRAVTAQEFLRGTGLAPGTILASVAAAS